MRLVGSDRGLKEVQVGETGKVTQRHKDGTFHVDGSAARTLLKTGDFAVAGTTFRSAQGYRCTACNFLALFKDKCGKCGCTELTPEDDE